MTHHVHAYKNETVRNLSGEKSNGPWSSSKEESISCLESLLKISPASAKPER